MRSARWVLGGALVLLVPGCFFYDSRWGQRSAEQENEARRLAPAKLRRGGRPSADAKVVPVRAYATPAYVAETLGWEERFSELLADASEILGAHADVRLVSGGTSVWEPSADGSDLTAVLEELSGRDDGRDAGWVVAFVQSTPKLGTDIHTLGKARVFSKHLALRASNNPADMARITRGLDEIDETRRAELYAKRRHHRMVVVFLHELGHTLGAVHGDKKTGFVMSPVYDSDVATFEPAAAGLVRVMLPLHVDGVDGREAAKRLLEYYRAHPSGFRESARTDLVTWLEAYVEPARARRASGSRVGPGQATPPTPGHEPAGAVPTRSPHGPPERAPLDSLTAEDRARYDDALTARTAGEAARAWRLLQPLMEVYPGVIEVQEFRCELAREQRFGPAIVGLHCAPLRALKGRGATAE